MRLGYWLLLLTLILPTTLRANVKLQLSADAEGSSCEIADPGPNGIVSVHVLLRYNQGNITGIFFRAPAPPGSGVTHVADNTPFARVGNSQTGVALGFGACITDATVPVMTMQFVRTSEGTPCAFYAAESNAFYSDCVFVDMPVRSYGGVALNSSNGQCNPVPIHDIAPANGAIDAPLVVSLSWKNGYYVCNAPLAAAAPSDDFAELYFGTSANPPFVDVVQPPHVVGPLQPGTKYYWRVYTQGPYLGTPVMSFTTTNNLAVQPSTWGAIKALYR